MWKYLFGESKWKMNLFLGIAHQCFFWPSCSLLFYEILLETFTFNSLIWKRVEPWCLYTSSYCCYMGGLRRVVLILRYPSLAVLHYCLGIYKTHWVSITTTSISLRSIYAFQLYMVIFSFPVISFSTFKSIKTQFNTNNFREFQRIQLLH